MQQNIDACGICSALSSEPPPIAYPPPLADDERERVDRIRGCLFGAAIGDAVGRLMRQGLPVPDLPAAASLQVGGATQLALFSAEGMVRMLVRYKAKGIGPAFSVNRHAYDRWLFTQGYPGDAELLRARWGWGVERWPDGWLVHRHELHHRRSTMTTTAQALRHDEMSEVDEDRHLRPRPNRSRGAGAVVRAAPGGLLVVPEFAFEMGVRLAGYTHGHPDAFLGAGVLSALVCRILHGERLDEALVTIRADLDGWPGSERLYPILDAVADDRRDLATPSPALAALVHGLRSVRGDVKPVVAAEKAASAGGTAAAVIAGQVLGVMHGIGAWPDAWRMGVEVGSAIDWMAEAVGVAHRAWDLGRDIPGAEWQSRDIFEEHPVSVLLWPRFPGW